MNKQILIIEIVFSSILLLSVETNGDMISELGQFAQFGQCGISINNNENFAKCKEKITDNWKADSDPKKQVCCKPKAFVDCTLETAKEVCSESDYKNVEKVQKTALAVGDTSCVVYRQTPSICGTCALLPVLSMIVILCVAVLRIS